MNTLLSLINIIANYLKNRKNYVLRAVRLLPILFLCVWSSKDHPLLWEMIVVYVDWFFGLMALWFYCKSRDEHWMNLPSCAKGLNMQIDKLKLLESDSLHCWKDWGELTDLNSRRLFTDSKNLLLLCRVGPFIGPISLCPSRSRVREGTSC